MVKKKGRKKTSKKKVSKKQVSKKKTGSKRLVRATKRKINLVIRNLIVFGGLFLISFCLYRLSSNLMIENLFYLLAIILGFIGLSFFIVLLALLIMKLMKK
jgi:uncharacterized membrane protein YcfT